MRREYVPNHSMRTMLLDTKNKKQNKKDITRQVNYRPIYPMNIHAKLLNKMLSDQIQPYTKRIINHDQLGIISGM